jgi:murein DD-endopeptidase MepM/ murein hydrolase activator NlpD
MRSSGAFLWPVRGHVVATYGSRSDGTHNDGINIAAPKGAAVQVAEAGVVAYSGNELRGYGNLILVKHPNGWISAYAHCDQMLVQRGQKVARGQVIARVGSTGNVSEPQLHFELRRGNHAVDPQEFLMPLPTAGSEKTAPRS